MSVDISCRVPYTFSNRILVNGRDSVQELNACALAMGGTLICLGGHKHLIN